MWSRSCPVVIRSMPAAPPLRLTASQAAVALSRLTISSIRLSYIAFFDSFRGRLLRYSAPHVRRGFTASTSVSQSGLGDRSCRRPPFRILQSPADYCLALFLHSSALRSALLSQGFSRYYGLC